MECDNHIKCPQGHIDTYEYDSSKDGLDYGLLLMCNVCEDGYQLEVKVEVTHA